MTQELLKEIVQAHGLQLQGLEVLNSDGQVLAFGSSPSATYAGFCNSRQCGFKPGFDGDYIMEYETKQVERHVRA